MHQLIRQQWRADGEGAQLAHIRYPEGSLVMAFRRDVTGPSWVAKQAVSTAGRIRLRSERRALEWLAPWRNMLRIPRVLAWSEGEEGAFLILSGIGGGSRFPALQRGRSLDPGFECLQNWLRQMHRLVPSPENVDLPALHRRWRQELGELPQYERSTLGLWGKFEHLTVPSRPAVAVHNDFWWGNLVFDGDRIGVIDWDGFRAGTPLDDLLTLLFKTPVVKGWSQVRGSAAFCWTFFEASPTRRLLRRWAGEYGLSSEEAESCFYSFLVRRLHWELGMALQPRTAAEQYTALLQWIPILGWLTEQRYPNPFAA